jgi:alpha-beta hydrolase superfamily lysophospholipase
MGPPLKSTDIAYLLQSMPPLAVDSAPESAWSAAAQVQAYLDFYQINFSRQDSQLVHKFGYLELAGFRVAVHLWLPQRSKGTLFVVHGYYDHVGLYGNAIAYGLAQSLAVVAFDLPGHGLSSGERNVIDNFNQYADVLDGVVNYVQSVAGIAQPFYGLGQSTGGAIWLNYLWRYEAARGVDKLFPRIALCAPLILPQGWKLGRYLYLLVKHFINKMPRGPSRSSHNPAFNDFVDNQDPLQTHYLSVRWVGAMKAWNAQFCQFIPRTDSLLVVQGNADLTVEWRYNLPLIQAKLPAARIHMLAGARHQLVNESEQLRAELFTQISAYFFTE